MKPEVIQNQNTTDNETSNTQKNHWGWLMTLGACLIVIGCSAILFPTFSTITAKIAIGWILLISGIITILSVFSRRIQGEKFFNFVLGVLYIAAGVWLAFFPLKGILPLTIFLAIFFMIEGVLEISYSSSLNADEGRGYILFSGLVSLIVGILIFAGLPASAAWALGLLVGVNLISTGWAFISIALNLKENTREVFIELDTKRSNA